MRLLRKVLRVVLWPFRLWRLALAGVLLLAAAHVIVDQVLLRKLAAQTEQIRSAGRPVTYADLKLPEYTAIDNANTVYEQSMDMIRKASEDGAWSRYALLVGRYVPTNPQVPRKDDRPLSEEERLQLGDYLQRIQPALDQLRTSKDCRVCIIPDFMAELNAIHQDNEKHVVVLPSLSRMRELTRYAAAKGLWECQRGNSGEGFDWFAIGLSIANNHSAHPTLIGSLNRVGCVATVLGAVETTLYEGEVPAVLPVSFSSELQKCLDRSIYYRTFESERLYSHEASIRMGFQAWRVMRPVFSLDQLRMNQFYLELADTFKSADFPAQEARLNELRLWSEKSSRIYMMTKIMVPASLRSVESMRRIMVSSGMCEIALKLKQFRQKNGAYPESLSELAQPLPTDPFSGNAFNYKREGDGFRLLSAGKKVAGEGKKRTEITLAWCAIK